MHTRQERADALEVIAGDIQEALDHLDTLIDDAPFLPDTDRLAGHWNALDVAVRHLVNSAEKAEAEFDRAGNQGVAFP